MSLARPLGARGAQRGMVLVVVTILLTVIFAFAGLAVDSVRLHTESDSLQAAVDAAALAATLGLREGPDRARQMAAQYAAKNTANGYAVAVDAQLDVALGLWDGEKRRFSSLAGDSEGSADAIRVVGRLTRARGNPVLLSFMPLLGRNSADLEVSATATFGGGSEWDIVLVQDVTSSFREAIDAARLADQALLDCLHERAAEDSLFGIVAFTGIAAGLSPMKPVGSAYPSLSGTVARIRECGSGGMPRCSGTSPAAGLQAALDTFRDTPPSSDDAERAIVLVSDGEPNCTGREGCSSDAQIAADGLAAADAADAAGISVFSIYYSGGSRTGSAYLKSLVRGDGFFIDEPNAGQLTTALRKVCYNLPPRLVD